MSDTMTVSVLIKHEQPVGDESSDTEITVTRHGEVVDVGVHPTIVTLVEHGQLMRYDPDKVHSILIVKEPAEDTMTTGADVSQDRFLVDEIADEASG